MKRHNRTFPSLHIYAHGECMLYAFVASHVLDATAYSYINYRRGDGHCFFKINDLYFDSENSEGKKNWRSLQCYLKNIRKPLYRHNKNTTILPKWGRDENVIKEWTEIAEAVKINYQGL